MPVPPDENLLPPEATVPPDPDELPADSPDAAVDEVGPEHRQFLVRREVDQRLDKYLYGRLKGISRNKIQQLIDLGGVTVNNRHPKAAQIVHPHDVIDVILPPPAVRHIRPEPIPLDILYEDEHLIVLNKQADLIVHPARGNLFGTLVNGLAYHFAQQGKLLHPKDTQPTLGPDGKSIPDGAVGGLSSVGADDFRPGIIHRLDKNTTGVIVVAKSDAAHWQIARQFEHRTTLKAYLALVHGSIEGIGGVIDQPIGKHPTIREAYAVRHDSVGKPSVTLYRIRERYHGYTLVELELKTGRTHQIRVHLSHMGYPIVGDIIYGGEPLGRRELDDPPIAAGSRKMLNFAREKAQGEELERVSKERPDILLTYPALHAALLSFTHPIPNQRLTFTAPLHEPMATLIRELRQRPAPGPVATEGFHVDLGALLSSCDSSGSK